MTVSPADEVAPPESAGTPRAVALVSVGALLIGGSGYLFLVLIGHGRFDDPTAAALSVVYLLSVLLGPGIFVAVEQETSRLTSTVLQQGGDLRSALRSSGLVSALLATVALVALVATAPVLLDPLFDGDPGLVGAIGVMMLGSAAIFWIRGAAAGTLRFTSYATTVLIDAGCRIAGCGALAVAGVRSPTLWALAICSGPLVASIIAVAVPFTRPSGGAVLIGATRPRSDAASVGRVLRATTPLLVASVLSMAMANLAPVLVKGALSDAPEVAFSFTTAVLLTRVPLLLMGPVQSMVLPGMARAVAQGRMDDFRRQLRRGLLVVTVMSGLAILGAAFFGGWALRLLFGTGADLIGGGRLAELAVSAGLQAAILLVQPALVALRQHDLVLIGWVAGAVVFGLSFALPLAPIDRATVAQLAGPAATLGVHLIVSRAGRSQRSVTGA